MISTYTSTIGVAAFKWKPLPWKWHKTTKCMYSQKKLHII